MGERGDVWPPFHRGVLDMSFNHGEGDTPFQEKVRKAADNAILTLAARWAVVVTLPMGAAMGSAVYNKLERTSESTARLEEKVTALLSSTLPQLNVQLDGRFNSLSDRVTAGDRRLDRLEDWRNSRQ